MIRAAGLRWKIEQDNQTGKDQLGLDYQVPKWTPWCRHVTLAMLAAAFLTVTRVAPGKRPGARTEPECRLSLPQRWPSVAAIRALLAATVLTRLADPARALTRDPNSTRTEP